MINNGTKLDPIAEMIKKHEGLKLKPYRCTSGKLTIGYGRNLQDVGITVDEADYLFETNYKESKADAILFVGPEHWEQLNLARQGVLIDMAFNLGATKLNEFHGLRRAVQNGNWPLAASHMRGSLWFKQVKRRGVRLADMMESGAWRK